MKKVDEREFFKTLMNSKKDIISTVKGNYPYTVIFKERHSGKIFGIVEEKEIKGKYPPIEIYYLND